MNLKIWAGVQQRQSDLFFFPALSSPLPPSLTGSAFGFYFFCGSCFFSLFLSLCAVDTGLMGLNVAGIEDFFCP